MTHSDIIIPQNGTVVSGSEVLRVGSLNLLNQHDNLQGRLDALVEEINANDFDVLCLQEALDNSEVHIAAYLIEHTHLRYSYRAKPKEKANGDRYGTLTLSRAKFVKKGQEAFHTVWALGHSIIPATYTVSELNGRQVHIFNVHFTWGSAAEPIRNHQADIIAFTASAIRREDPEAIILLAGDFNATDQSSTVRFLHGLASSNYGRGTLWVDAWKMWGTDTNEITSDPNTYWGRKTGARKSNLFNVELIPKRRIDYLLAYDWCYGKEGSPLSFQQFANKRTGDEGEISDHAGVYADFWVPPVKVEPEVTTIKVTADEVQAARIEVQAQRSAGLTPDPLVVQLAEVE